MLNFFDTIVEFFSMIWQFIQNIVSSLLTATNLIANLPVFAVTLSGLVPGFLGSCILIVVSIGILKLIVGWGNQ